MDYNGSQMFAIPDSYIQHISKDISEVKFKIIIPFSITIKHVKYSSWFDVYVTVHCDKFL